MVLGYVITPVGLRVEFLWNDALYSAKTHCGVLDVIIELTMVRAVCQMSSSGIHAQYRANYAHVCYTVSRVKARS